MNLQALVFLRNDLSIEFIKIANDLQYKLRHRFVYW